MFCQKCGTQNPDNGRFCRACGVDLGNSFPASGTFIKPIKPKKPIKSPFCADNDEHLKSNDPDELWSSGIQNIIIAAGFLTVSMALLITGVAGGHAWWWTMLIPAFTTMAKGVSQISKSKRIMKRQPDQNFKTANELPFSQMSALPESQTDYVKPQQSIYDTGELVRPPSVTEGTTRHLEMNNEAETMTLPANNK